MLENVLCLSLCSEEHTWEITESGEFCQCVLQCYLQYHCRDLCGYGSLEQYQVYRFAPQQVDVDALTEGFAQPPEHSNVPYILTHSPNCFRSTISTFMQLNSSRRLLVFKPHAATPLPRVFFFRFRYLDAVLLGM